MTPEEKAVIEQAVRWSRTEPVGQAEDASEALQDFVAELLRSRMPTEVLKQEWVPATLVQCLAGDHIRIGTDETDVIRTDGGRVWHADNTNPYRPKPWKHIELRMELAANPGFQEYPPNTPCEILCTPERAASLAFQSAFSGSAVTSSDVD